MDNTKIENWRLIWSERRLQVNKSTELAAQKWAIKNQHLYTQALLVD